MPNSLLPHAVTLAVEGRTPELAARLAAFAAQSGVAAMIDDVVTPAFERLGRLFACDALTVKAASVAHRALADAARRAMPDVVVDPKAPRAVVATLVGNGHGLGGEFLAGVLAAAGWRTETGITLGVDAAGGESVGAADVVAVSVALESEWRALPGVLAGLRARLPHALLLVGGPAVRARAGRCALPYGAVACVDATSAVASLPETRDASVSRRVPFVAGVSVGG